MAPPQQSKLRQGVEPCRFECNGKDDAERRRQNKGSGNGETKADRALIVRGSRRLPRRETLVLWADNGLCPAQAGSASPIEGNFMDMPNRKPELQCQSQQRKPRTETARYCSNAFDHPLDVCGQMYRRNPSRSEIIIAAQNSLRHQNRTVAAMQDQPKPEEAVARSYASRCLGSRGEGQLRIEAARFLARTGGSAIGASRSFPCVPMKVA